MRGLVPPKKKGNMRTSASPSGDESLSLPWQIPSLCAGESGCVAVALTGDGVAVKDSKSPTSPILWFSQQEWRNFVASARLGEFDI